jgi:L-amino acid N-acyltransferase YncA
MSGANASRITVRASEDSDVPDIAAIYRHHVLEGTGTFEIQPPDVREIARRRQDLVQRGFPWLVAEVNGAVAGYAYAGPFRAREAYRFTLEDSIYVRPNSMKQGVGGVLLRELVEVCRRGGFRQIVALIGDSSNHGSIRVHEVCGFQHTGVMKNVGMKFDRWLDVVIMQLELGENV